MTCTKIMDKIISKQIYFSNNSIDSRVFKLIKKTRKFLTINTLFSCLAIFYDF